MLKGFHNSSISLKKETYVKISGLTWRNVMYWWLEQDLQA